MFSATKDSIIFFIICVVILLVLFCTFIITLIYKYQQRQIAYFKELEELKAIHENTLLQSQLEMQEQTFQHIAREIHDNIGQKLTLAKLYLHTLSYNDIAGTTTKIDSSLVLISLAISDLSDISRGMSTDLIENNGLVKVIELEVDKLKKSGMYQVGFSVEGTEVFLDTNREVVLFRIVQEAVNNILKHSGATAINIRLIYNEGYLTVHIEDNGKGFDISEKKEGAGLINMQKRTAHLHGDTSVISNEKGTNITIKIPINENHPN
jgi:two-component system, NarL family, sensor kinase